MKRTTTFILTALGIIVLVNILSDNFFLRMDLTADNRYTLSKASKNIIRNLKEPVTITAYFSGNIPSELSKTKRDFREMLIEYHNISKGQVVYEFIDPSADQETEQKAMSAGIQPVIANIREKDQVKQQKVYLGAVISMGEESENIPFMQPGAAMEYALSSAIKKVSVKNKPSIGIIQGHGEPGLAAMAQAYTALNVMYEVEPVFLTDTSKNLMKFNTVALIAPKDTIPDSHLAQLDEFLAKGGKLLLAVNRVEGNLSVQRGLVVNTGLETWLMGKGLIVERKFRGRQPLCQYQCQAAAGHVHLQHHGEVPVPPDDREVRRPSDHQGAGIRFAAVRQYHQLYRGYHENVRTAGPDL
jgi:gliding-associated putative ABC transporter substrate-binding component GldG